jgi:hypothetical protein
MVGSSYVDLSVLAKIMGCWPKEAMAERVILSVTHISRANGRI